MEGAVLTIVPPDASNVFFDRLVHPGRFYAHPREVLSDPTLDRDEKRAILSSWASDACAVESMPALRQPPGAAEPVSFDAIMDALRSLDMAEARGVAPGPTEAGAAPISLHIF
jgi:hypothetical protein